MGDALYPETLDATTIACRQFSIGGARIPAHKGNHFFVDYDLGNNGYSGKSWDKAWLSVAYALTQVSDWDTVWVAGRGSEETLVVPVGLDHLTLRGAHVSQRAWHLENNAGSVTDPNIRCRANFFTLMDVFIEPTTDAAALVLIRDASEAVSKGNHATLVNVEVWTGRYGVDLQGAPHGFRAYGCKFRNLRSSGGTGIYVSDVAQTMAHRAHIKGCTFKGNINHLVGAFADSLIEDNSFSAKANGDNDTTSMIDLRNGASNDVTRNHLAGTYAEPQYYASGSEDNWFGNYTSAGISTANPA